MAADSFSGNQCRKPRMKFEFRFAAPVRHYADALQGHRIAESSAHRFGKRLLRCKPVGDKEHRIDGFLKSRPFACRQYATRKALSILLEQSLDSMRLNH